MVWARPVCGARAGGETSGLTHRCCLLVALWDGDYQAPSLLCLSTLLLPGAPSSFFKSTFSALLQNTSMSWMGALTHVCRPGFCCCHPSHFSMAWLWWAAGLPLAGPTELYPAEKEFISGHHLQGTARGNRPTSSVLLGQTKLPLSFLSWLRPEMQLSDYTDLGV